MMGDTMIGPPDPSGGKSSPRLSRKQRRNALIGAGVALVMVLWSVGIFGPQTVTPANPIKDLPHVFQAKVTMAIDPTTQWQPRQGEVKFTLQGVSNTIDLTDVDVQANYRWSTSTNSGTWYHSPGVRLVASPNPQTLTLAAPVPNLPQAPAHPILGIRWDHADGFGMLLGLVPQVDLWITANTKGAGTDEPALVNQVEEIGVTNGIFALIGAIVTIVILMWFLHLYKPIGVAGGNIFLTLIATGGKRASLSQFQLVLWTLLIGGATVYVIALSGDLIPISSGTLVLLGISGAATLGSQLAPTQPSGGRPSDGKPSWRDLVEADGQIDVTRVQMLFFTVLVAVFVLIHVIDNYEIPEVPESFLALMGISNGVYVLNKFVKNPGSSPPPPAP
jgi:hypothetical protein